MKPTSSVKPVEAPADAKGGDGGSSGLNRLTSIFRPSRSKWLGLDPALSALDTVEWMTKLPPSLKAGPLWQLAIPGSHNSFTYSLDRRSVVGPDEKEWMRQLARRCSWIAKPMIYRWAVCQAVSCIGQMELGVRYFDFRLGKDCMELMHRIDSGEAARRSNMVAGRDRVEICVIHALFGCDVECALTEISNFLKAHESEVVVLDFQHIYGFEEEDRCYVTNLVLALFGGRMCPVVEDVSLDYMSRHGYQVIALNKIGAENSEFFWPRRLCPNPWANTPKTEVLSEFLDAGLSGWDRKRFFVSQGILTPNNRTFLFHPFCSLETCLVKKCNKFLKTEWLPELVRRKAKPNIVITDFVEQGNMPASIINLNYILAQN